MDHRPVCRGWPLFVLRAALILKRYRWNDLVYSSYTVCFCHIQLLRKAYHMQCKRRVSLGTTSTESCHTTMGHWLAPTETDLGTNQEHIIRFFVLKWTCHKCKLYVMKWAFIPVMPDVPYLDCGLILYLLFLVAMAAAVKANYRPLKWDLAAHKHISRSQVTVYLECFLFSLLFYFAGLKYNKSTGWKYDNSSF